MTIHTYTLGERLKGVVKAWAAVLIVSWIGVPLVISILYAFSERTALYERTPIPLSYSLEQIRFLLFEAGALYAVKNSVIVALLTVALSFLLGLPAGYAFAKYVFPGRDALKLALIGMRMFPVMIIAVPLVALYIRIGLSDTLVGVALAHTAMALPFVVLITSSVFAGVPRDLEEAGMVFGLSPIGVFLRITIPLALPGLAAAAMFTFLLSWNEVFIAAVLTLTNRTLPAFILTSALAAPDFFKFAANFIIVAPALVFVFVARRYLVTMWGITVR
ncbi:MAG: carbohydrate ABC transporter permease [Desulfurococcales archaeon]|nr:carbohydrate ABC transporter permease [Desulfurococcales archaeon]